MEKYKKSQHDAKIGCVVQWRSINFGVDSQPICSIAQFQYVGFGESAVKKSIAISKCSG